MKLDKKKITVIFASASLMTALMGCAKTVENKTVDTSSSQATEKTYAEEFDEYIDSKKEADSTVEAAISVMLDGGEKLKDSASEAAGSEEVQESFENSLQNFKDLNDFIEGDKEINGITYDELSDEGKEMVNNAKNSLDTTIEEIHPNYKEDFKEWFTDKAAQGLDKAEELKEDAKDLWDEIQSKRKR